MDEVPTAAQEAAIQEAVASCQFVAENGRGRLLFVAGESGSGRKKTLRWISDRLANALPAPLVVGGAIDGKTFGAWSGNVEEQRPSGVAFRSCCQTQATVGCSVTLKWTK